MSQVADRSQADGHPEPGPGLAAADDADPPVRRAVGDALPEAEDRRLLPPVQRPGAGGRRLDRRPPRGRLRHHRLPRPRPRPGPRAWSAKAAMAELLGKATGCSKGKGGLDALLRRREGLPRRPRDRRQPHPAGRRASPSPSSTAARTASASATSATARWTRGRSTRRSTWPRSGSCRSSTSSRTT